MQNQKTRAEKIKEELYNLNETLEINEGRYAQRQMTDEQYAEALNATLTRRAILQGELVKALAESGEINQVQYIVNDPGVVQ